MKSKLLSVITVAVVLMLFVWASDGDFATEARNFMRQLLRAVF
ncbi:hypothetical protein [Enterobacillus tribolii]|uniref:Uncharacterized protein n=1 Tax=Enterobacillus tribolii TaxID=1487935 RepID=A0A370QRW9_9GAMM|nr:hypothetical protein [Enterobacillus tribolii]RDK92020.1 hypothetical protein C8D90_104172 [Enterobacillus tribolii]